MKNCEEEAICKAFFQSCLHSEQIFSQSSIDINYHIYIRADNSHQSTHFSLPFLRFVGRGEKEKEKEKGKISRRKVFHSRRVPSIRGL